MKSGIFRAGWSVAAALAVTLSGCTSGNDDGPTQDHGGKSTLQGSELLLKSVSEVRKIVGSRSSLFEVKPVAYSLASETPYPGDYEALTAIGVCFPYNASSEVLVVGVDPSSVTQEIKNDALNGKYTAVAAMADDKAICGQRGGIDFGPGATEGARKDNLSVGRDDQNAFTSLVIDGLYSKPTKIAVVLGYICPKLDPFNNKSLKDNLLASYGNRTLKQYQVAYLDEKQALLRASYSVDGTTDLKIDYIGLDKTSDGWRWCPAK